MKRECRNRFGISVLTVAGLLLLSVHGQPVAASEWPRWETPEEAGFSSSQIADAERLWNGLGGAPQGALFVVYRGKVLAAFGDSSEEYLTPTVRASLLSALYGAHIDSGAIDLEATLEGLAVNDDPRLTRAEQQAKVVHLLESRSGVYHPAACESQAMRDARPDRGSHAPGTFWHLNNWDVNALGTIFWKQTGTEIFQEFEARIAGPLGMQDFQADDCDYRWDMIYSIHPCYWFRMSVRDRARLGQLFLQRGKWGDRQVIPEWWIEASTRAQSQSGTPGLGSGYQWWAIGPELFEEILENRQLHHLRGFAATDFQQQLILGLPDGELVVALGADTNAENIGFEETLPIIEKIISAREIIDLASRRSKVKPRSAMPGETLRIVTSSKNLSNAASQPTEIDFYLSPEPELGNGARWIGSGSVPRLVGGGGKTIRLRASIPADLAPGDHYLIAVVDQDKANYDLSRDNNVSVSKKAVQIGE